MEKRLPPVLFIVFNRPDKTKIVFEEIRKAKPSQLFVAADGPRDHVEADAGNCAATRAVIKVDWDCEVKTLYREKNLGCKAAVSEAINWFFNHVEEGIILEDDCQPSTSFFGFCRQLLERYKEDERIMMISGTNLVGKWKENESDYFYSYYGGIWGWATWRRAWAKYDVAMSRWSDPKARESVRNVLVDPAQWKERERLFDEVHRGAVDTWDYQWGFCRLLNSGLSIVPGSNLISNIGFGAAATHTTGPSELADRPRFEINLPVRENDLVFVDRQYDEAFFKQGKYSLLKRIQNKFFRKHA